MGEFKALPPLDHGESGTLKPFGHHVDGEVCQDHAIFALAPSLPGRPSPREGNTVEALAFPVAVMTPSSLALGEMLSAVWANSHESVRSSRNRTTSLPTGMMRSIGNTMSAVEVTLVIL